MSLQDQLATALKPRLIYVGGLLFGCKRVNSRQLMQVGECDLEGEQGYRKAQKEQARTNQAERARAVGADDETIAQIEEREKAQARRELVASIEILQATPARARAIQDRFDAFMCASVYSAVVIGPTMADELGWKDGATVRAKDLPQGLLEGMEPLELQPTKTGPNLWVMAFTERTRAILGTAIMAAQDTQAEVAPFCLGSDPSDQGRSACQAVRQVSS